MRTVRLAGELRSALEARRLVEDELGPAGVGDDTMLHTQLVVTELVTNAARHAHTPVEVTVSTALGRVRIEARDGSAAVPTSPSVDTPTRHRGIHLIEDLSDCWGVEAQDADGKVVWCELTSRGSPAEASSRPLPPARLAAAVDERLLVEAEAEGPKHRAGLGQADGEPHLQAVDGA